MTWPDLSAIGFVSGRAATDADVQAGNAAFVLKEGGVPAGIPLDLPVPQYAIHVDAETGWQTAGVVIQAEEAGSLSIVGMLVLRDGSHLVGRLGEFTLLGIVKPETPPPG
jgi:hypothetical protein